MHATHPPAGPHWVPTAHILFTQGAPVELELAAVVDELVVVVVDVELATVTAGFPVLELEPVLDVVPIPPAPPAPAGDELHPTTKPKSTNPRLLMRAA